MKHHFKMHQSVIALVVLLMMAFIGIMVTAFNPAFKSRNVALEMENDDPDWGEIRSESEVFRERNSPSLQLKNSRSSQHVLIKNRAYPGAPPQIPHAVDETVSASGKSCLSCHAQGGYSQAFQAFAPIAPHPQFESCRQCHTTKVNDGLFKPTTWVVQKVAPRGFAHLPGAPPIIPHPLHLRGSCLSCHSGPGSRADIRVTHPERTNCRQCHVSTYTDQPFVRSALRGEP